MGVRRLLTPGGKFSLILPDENVHFVTWYLRPVSENALQQNDQGCHLARSISKTGVVYPGRKGNQKKREEVLTINQEPGGEYTPGFKKLTRDFYLNF